MAEINCFPSPNVLEYLTTPITHFHKIIKDVFSIKLIMNGMNVLL
jgi:hypothetical protein